MLKKFLLIIFLCCQVQAADYFVKNTGSDAEDGLSDGNAWETISKVNGVSFVAGDTISFNKGDTWREQLTVPTSGSDGSPITYSAYGTGDAPLIIGSEITTGWVPMLADLWNETFDSVGYDEIWSEGEVVDPGCTLDEDYATSNVGSPDGWGDKCLQSIIDSDSLRAKVKEIVFGDDVDTWVKFEFQVLSHDFDASNEWIFLYNTFDESDTALTRCGVRYDGTGLQLRCDVSKAGGGYTNHLWDSGAYIALDTVYRVEIKCKLSTDDWEWWVNGISQHTESFTVGHAVGLGRINGFGGEMIGSGHTSDSVVDGLAISSTGQVKNPVYRVGSITTRPDSVVYNDVKLTQNDVGSGVENTLGMNEWTYHAGDDRVFVNVGEDPDLGTMELGTRLYGINIVDKNWIVIDGIDCVGAIGAGINVYNADNNVVQNNSMYQCGSNGINLRSNAANNLVYNSVAHSNGHFTTQAIGGGFNLDQGATNNTISYCEAYGNEEDGIGLVGVDIATWIGPNNIVEHCDSYNNKESGIDCKFGPQIIRYNSFHDNTGVNGEGLGIMVGWDSTGVTVAHNEVYNNVGDGIKYYNTGDSHIIEYNEIYNNGNDGIDISGDATFDGGAGTIIRYNVVYENGVTGGDAGIKLTNDYATGSFIYNNTVWGNTLGHQCFVNASSTTIKNNIFIAPANKALSLANTTNQNSDNNCVTGTGTFMRWGGASYNWADYLTNSSQDAASINADPLFVDEAGDDFQLKILSPCIDAGISVGLSTDFDGKRIVGIPEIGAYEFTLSNVWRFFKFRFLNKRSWRGSGW